MSYSPIPKEELDLFKQLKDLKVIFDVGARDDADYLEIWPDSEHHLFEPNPGFFEELLKKTRDRDNVFVNNFGLGDKNEERGYMDGQQTFVGSEALPQEGNARDRLLPIKKLDDYCKEKGIKEIDFLKIDTEGFDYKVLVGGEETLKNTRFIQYEHWDDKDEFHLLLGDDFEMEYIGYRNVFCMSKTLVPQKEKERLIQYITQNKMAELK